MVAKYEQTTLGEAVIPKLKDIFYPNISWQTCYKEVAQRLSALMTISRKFYADKSDLDILKELIKYSTDDIRDAFGLNDTKNSGSTENAQISIMSDDCKNPLHTG
jgi:predicted nuclease of restriction endonuclease-like RecB superfamily